MHAEQPPAPTKAQSTQKKPLAPLEMPVYEHSVSAESPLSSCGCGKEPASSDDLSTTSEAGTDDENGKQQQQQQQQVLLQQFSRILYRSGDE